MRDEKRKQLAMLEEAYEKVNEMSMSPSNPVSVGSVQAGPLTTSDEEICGGGQPDISTVAAQAIAAITELAAAAGANISVTVEIGEQEIEEVEVIDQFNTGYEDVGST